MQLEQLLNEVSGRILAAKGEHPLRVGIDGIDAAGKSVLADGLAAHLEGGGQAVLRASIDGFHNPRQVRRRRGADSPLGYYHDSFNYELLKECLLDPLAPGGSRRCRLAAFDYRRDCETPVTEFTAAEKSILLFDGVFLFRPELSAYWDFKIFVDITFETSLERALQRDLDLFGGEEEVLKRYRKRYLPGQKLYLEEANPRAIADLVIDNNNYCDPKIIS